MLGDDRTLPDLCTELGEIVRRRDGAAFGPAYDAAVARVGRADAGEMTAAVGVLADFLVDVPLGNGAELAVLVGGLVERGADPTGALGTIAERVAEGLERAARFPALWREVGTGDPPEPPEPEDQERVPEVLDRVGDQGRGIVEAWFTVGDWIPGLLVPLQRADVRRDLPHRARLTEATAATRDEIGTAGWLYGLLLVLDDETLVVLHRATGRGYEVTIGGIGDNFQLHTLLAGTLIGKPRRGLVPGKPPKPSWVAAATDGEIEPAGGIEGLFNLVDAYGKWIWNEGRPADIPVLDGRRVVVIDPPPYERGWNAGRVYPLMRPTIILDRVLPDEEAARWMRRIAPEGELGRSG